MEGMNGQLIGHAIRARLYAQRVKLAGLGALGSLPPSPPANVGASEGGAGAGAGEGTDGGSAVAVVVVGTRALSGR